MSMTLPAPVMAETIRPAELVQFPSNYPNPARRGHIAVVIGPLDRGELTNVSGFPAGVLMRDLRTGDVISVWVRSPLHVVTSILSSTDFPFENMNVDLGGA